MIKTLKGFYRAIDALLQGISKTCGQCRDDCCFGYVWLMPEESKRLYRQGFEIVEINRRACFINSFSDGKGGIDIGQFKPPCPYCKERKCTIRTKRPLVCRMYPLGFFHDEGIIKLALYLDCLFSRKKAEDDSFKKRATALFKTIDPSLLRKIIRAYMSVLEISDFPKGPNRTLPFSYLARIEGR